MIVIIDYNVGNLKSVVGAFKRIGLEAVVSRDEKVIKEAKGIVLPGVGTFPTAMKNLEKYHLVDILTERKEAGIPILGICLGMQILFEKGYEVKETILSLFFSSMRTASFKALPKALKHASIT